MTKQNVSLHDEWLDNINATYAGFPEGLIVFLEHKVASLQSQNAELLEALKTLDRAHKKGFIDLKNFHNVPTKAIRKATLHIQKRKARGD